MSPPDPNESPRFIKGRIVRSEDPPNLEMPFETLDRFITPTELFYVRTHFPIPRIERNEWRLRVEGEVETPLEINYDQLLKLESRTMPVTLECAGNNRNFLEPKANGVQWGLGAVGTAKWTGVALSVLLDRAGIKSSACEVVLEGADSGKLDDPRNPTGIVKFARGIPVDKAGTDVLLAYKMNGAELSPQHGFPLRAVVPGWYAMASIKWLQRIIVVEKPFNGYYQTLDYVYCRRRGGLAEVTPISEMEVKAQIARPTHGEIVPISSTVRVCGAAWTGDGEIARVEISTDAGSTWTKCNLIGKSEPNAWRLWEFDWKTPATPGKVTLIARATDSHGRTQPMQHDPDRGAYMINRLLPITVDVR
jgi:DMSO/TMAO reductase YedYZ molybdopterin-dependent catalytic subunit